MVQIGLYKLLLINISLAEVEEWARSWLLAQRASGKVGYEVKKLNNTHYVYHSTTVWLKKEKKRKKVSRYLGKLDPELGLVGGRSGSPSRRSE